MESDSAWTMRCSIALACLALPIGTLGCGVEATQDSSRGFRIEGTEPGDCDDGADNDADGLFDCEDASCAASPLCADGGAGGQGGAGGAAGVGGAGGFMRCSGIDCDDQNECTEDTCDPADGSCIYTNLTDGMTCNFGALPGLCAAGACEDAMLCAGVDCDDQNECTEDTCDPMDGTCSHTNVTVGTSCDFGGLPGVCAVGVCEDAMLCAGVDCDDQNECTEDTCNPMDGICGHTNVTDDSACDFDGLPGVCTAGVCEDAMLCAGVDCDDQSECTEDQCDPMDGACGHTSVADGTACDSGGLSGLCRAGVCDGCFPVLCPDGNSYGCGDCIDNDGDGLRDDKDPECLGPCDDTEGPILQSGTPGETGNQCGVDCYFDRGNGSGSGECIWDLRCDPLEPKDSCRYDESLVGNLNYCPVAQPEGCEDQCGVFTPNGCDCFGCCTFPELNGEYVFLGSFIGNEGTCTLDDISNPELCRPCTPAGNCLNTCERCELCLGKSEIPADCFPGSGGAGGNRCPIGTQECGLPGDSACPAGSFCLTGCCTEPVLQ